jgi:tetratricopeptide (TPR) repeat protein
MGYVSPGFWLACLSPCPALRAGCPALPMTQVGAAEHDERAVHPECTQLTCPPDQGRRTMCPEACTAHYSPAGTESPSMVVVSVWTGRHATALQKALRLTNEQFAERLGTAVRTVAKWNANPALEQTFELQQALDTVLKQSPDDAKARFAQIIGENGSTTRGTRPGVNADSISTLVAEITSGGMNGEAIAQLEQATFALAECHTQVPAKNVLPQVLQLQRQAQQLMGRTHRLSQQRDLYRIESDLLAHACLLLGDLKYDQMADEYGLAAHAFALEAGSNPALAATALAKTYRWQERLIESAEMAREGYNRSPETPTRIQLASQEANAAALLGDAGRAREALRRSEQAAETVSPDSGVSAWSFPTGRQALFSLAVATETGDADTALRAVGQADNGWSAGEPFVPANWAQIRVGAGLAHLLKGDLDGATEEVTPMLTLDPERRVSTVTNYVAKLVDRLGQRKFSGDKRAAELRDQLREFNAGALIEDRPNEEGE